MNVIRSDKSWKQAFPGMMCQNLHLDVWILVEDNSARLPTALSIFSYSLHCFCAAKFRCSGGASELSAECSCREGIQPSTSRVWWLSYQQSVNEFWLRDGMACICLVISREVYWCKSNDVSTTGICGGHTWFFIFFWVFKIYVYRLVSSFRMRFCCDHQYILFQWCESSSSCSTWDVQHDAELFLSCTEICTDVFFFFF